jgi:hypothetical protein
MSAVLKVVENVIVASRTELGKVVRILGSKQPDRQHQ